MTDPTSLETLFKIASSSAMLGWIALVSGLCVQQACGSGQTGAVAARLLLSLGGRVIPLVLSLGYAAALLAWWGQSTGGFGSLEQVSMLFSSRGLLLAGWVHYLAFDLWVGRWIIDTVAQEPALHGVAHWAITTLLVGCLLLTFLFGPVGLLAFFALRQARRLAFRRAGQH